MQSNCTNYHIVTYYSLVIVTLCWTIDLSEEWELGCLQRQHERSLLSLPINYYTLMKQINLHWLYEILQNGVEERIRCEWLPHRIRLHAHTYTRTTTSFKVMWEKESKSQIQTRGYWQERERKRGKTEQGWEDQTSQQLSVEQGTEVTTGSLCRRGHREWLRSCRFVGTKEARGNDNTHPFAIVLGDGEKDGGIILMA